MEAKISIRRSHERTVEAASRLNKRQTRREILSTYMNVEEAAKSPPRKSLPSPPAGQDSWASDSTSPNSAKKVPEVWAETRNGRAKSWNPERSPPITQMPGSPQRAIKGGGVGARVADIEGGGMDAGAILPAGQCDKEAPMQFSFFGGGSDPASHSSGGGSYDNDTGLPGRPPLFRSTSDFLSMTRGHGDDDQIVLRRSIATGIALGATTGIIVGTNLSGRGGGGAAAGGLSFGKAAAVGAVGGVVGAGVGYGLSNPFKTA